MLIGSSWKIEATGLDITLSHKKKKTWEAVGYFATVGGALKELVNQGVRDTKLKDLKTICDKIDKVYAMIDVKTSSKVSHIKIKGH